MHVELLEISGRFCGPPRSGNGGYVCGRTARHLQGTVAVRLKMPPPLNVELRLESAEQDARLLHGASLIAEARRSPLDLAVPSGPSSQQAERAAHSFRGFASHPFPGCFVCGPEREPGDGLRIFPGPLAGSTTLAAPWTPAAWLADEHGKVQAEFLWSALDCSGGFAVLPVSGEMTAVLGELCAKIISRPASGEPCVVIGWPLGAAGRKRLAGSALYRADGRLIAKARAVWVEVPLDTWSQTRT